MTVSTRQSARSCGASVKGWAVSECREAKEAGKEAIRFVRTHNWKATAKLVFQRKYWGWWFLLLLTVTLSVILSAYHNQIITAINPYKEVILHQKWTWLIPVILLIIVSYPPLFGHELIILAVGVIWGLKIGFAIACAGTFAGEIALFYTFRYFLTEKAAKIEQKHVAYSCLARLMREGGLWMIILVRFSALPGHVTTAVQSTVGMSIWIYGIAAAISLPKQFALVYLGVIFGQTAIPLSEWRKTHADGVPLSEYYSGKDSESKRHRISLIVFAATTFATLIAAYIVWMRIRKIRPEVIKEMEARKAAEVAEAGGVMGEKTEEVGTTSEAPVLGYGQRQRPTFVAMDSSSRLALLGTRGRSGTTSTMLTNSSWGLNSPSLPHLPLGESVEYFSLEPGGASQKLKDKQDGDAAEGLEIVETVPSPSRRNSA